MWKYKAKDKNKAGVGIDLRRKKENIGIYKGENQATVIGSERYEKSLNDRAKKKTKRENRRKGEEEEKRRKMWRELNEAQTKNALMKKQRGENITERRRGRWETDIEQKERGRQGQTDRETDRQRQRQRETERNRKGKTWVEKRKYLKRP